MSRSEYYRVFKKRDSEEKELEKAVIHCFEKNRIMKKKNSKKKSLTVLKRIKAIMAEYESAKNCKQKT